MPFSAGQTITAAQLNRIQPVPYSATGTTLASGSLPASTEVDIPSATVTVSTSAANAHYEARGDFDFTVTTVGATLQGRLSVDGSTVSDSAVYTAPTNGSRTPGGWTWSGTLALAGSHTFKLRGIRDFASGTQQFTAAKLTVKITEVV